MNDLIGAYPIYIPITILGLGHNFDLDLHWINAKSNLSFIHGHLLNILQSDFKNYSTDCAYKACYKSQGQSVTLNLAPAQV